MMERRRVYAGILRHHLAHERQMAFVTGPRQVGKTTTCQGLSDAYLDWDNEDQRGIILQGPGAVARHVKADRLLARPQVVVMDELHKYPRWKGFLKGFFDTYQEKVRVIVTGSSRLDVYRRGGDSLMGRYFLFRMHPFSPAELLRTDVPDSPIRPPGPLDETDWEALVEHGGYPEPFVRRDTRFHRRWRNMRQTQFFREDVRDLTRIQEIDQLATMGRILEGRSGDQLVYSSLGSEIRASENTIRNWITVLCALNHGFVLRPWFRNVSRALRKEPKWFLRDWSAVDDPGKRAETMTACCLLKAVEGWTDLGLGSFDLRYVRDKEKRETDFVVLREGKPWFLVEVKQGDTALDPSLGYFQRQTGAPFAFQAIMAEDYIDRDCFSEKEPVVVPLRTLLSQLL